MAVTLSTHTLTQKSQDIALNQSTVQYLVKITTSGASHNDNNITTTFYIDGVKYTKTHKLPSNTTTTVVDKTVTITHNTDGTRSVTASFSTPTNISAGTMTGSKTLTLDSIPRYTTISSFTVSKRNETSLIFNWQTADTIDYVWYSTNNGSSWTGYDVADGTSGNFTVSGLSPNTTYNCKLRVRRKDSQLTTDSGTISQTTYNVPSQSLNSKTETSIKMNWSCDTTADYIWYSKDGGTNWTAVGSVNATSGNYTISSLSANTSYSIKTRVRRSTTQTTYDTSTSNQTTYQYPYVSAVSSSNLTIGNSQTLTLYNPLSRNCTIYMKKDSDSGTQLYSGTSSGTSIQFIPTASTLYSSIPNAKYGNCVYYCTYDGHHISTASGHKYIVNETINAPTMSSSSCKDTNSTTIALTGSDSKIVLNASTLLISVTASPKNSATISTITIDGSSRTISNNTATYSITKPTKTDYTVVITDSRGISLQTTVSIASGNVINYIPLTMTGVAKRNQPTDGKVNLSSSGKYYKGSFGIQDNTLTTSYNWREVGGSWQGWTTLNNTTTTGTHTEVQIQVSNKTYTKSYEFQFKAVDELNTVTSTITVPKGQPVYWWNEDGLYVNGSLTKNGSEVASINEIPSVGNATLTIQKNGTNVQTFTANATSNKTANITVPTKTSEITNDSGFITSSSLPTVNNATLTIQKNGTTVKTFTANASSNVTANITVPTNTNELTNGAGFITSSSLPAWSGSSFNYTLRFAKSGTYGVQIAFMRYTKSAKISNTWGSGMYTCSAFALPNYEKAFAVAPAVSIWTEGSNSAIVINSGTNGTGTTPPQIQLARGSSMSAAKDFYISVLAIGYYS